VNSLDGLDTVNVFEVIGPSFDPKLVYD